MIDTPSAIIAIITKIPTITPSPTPDKYIDTLQSIAVSVKNLSEKSDYVFLSQFVAFLLSIVAALITLYLREVVRKRYFQSRLVPSGIIKHRQGERGGLFVFRLILKNNSDYKAEKVQVSISEVIDPNAPRSNFIQAPLRWTHGNTEARDIFPHQEVWLDLLEVKQEQGKFIQIAAPNILGVGDMPYIRQTGTTTLWLKYYQSNGQSGNIEIKVDWNGTENFDNLPKVEIAKPEKTKQTSVTEIKYHLQ